MAITISVADWGYTQATGDIFAIGTVRPAWIAGPIALVGVGLACFRIVSAL